MHAEQRRQMLRLSAAAALQTHVGLGAVAAWDTSAMMPEAVQIELRSAATCPICKTAKREVCEIYARWEQTRAAAAPVEFPEFAEPVPRPRGVVSRHG